MEVRCAQSPQDLTKANKRTRKFDKNCSPVGIPNYNARPSTASTHLIHLLHLRRLIRSSLHLLKRGQVVVIAKALIVIINAQTQLDHAVDAARKLCWLIEVEAR